MVPEVKTLVETLITKLGLKKYQLTVGTAYGVYMIDLPTSGLRRDQMIRLCQILPEDASIGAFSNHGNHLVNKVTEKVGSEVKNAYLYISRKGNGSRLKK
jgi:hypothetical protein